VVPRDEFPEGGIKLLFRGGGASGRKLRRKKRRDSVMQKRKIDGGGYNEDLLLIRKSRGMDNYGVRGRGAKPSTGGDTSPEGRIVKKWRNVTKFEHRRRKLPESNQKD